MTENKSDDKKREPYFNPIFFIIFTGVGIAIGVATDNLPTWLAIGLGLGFTLSAVSYKKKDNKQSKADSV